MFKGLAPVAGCTVNHHGSTPRPDGRRPADEPTQSTDTTHTTPINTPMTPQNDEANSDAPLVPDLRATNRPRTSQLTDLETAQRELRWIRARLADVERRLAPEEERSR